MILTNTLLGTIRIHRIKWPRNEYELIEEKESRAGPGGRAGPQPTWSLDDKTSETVIALIGAQHDAGSNPAHLSAYNSLERAKPFNLSPPPNKK